MHTLLYILTGIAIGAAAAAAILLRRLSAAAREAARLSVEQERLATELRLTGSRLQECTARLAGAEAENKTLAAKAQAQAREIELLAAQAEEKARLNESRFAEQLRTAKEEMTNMAALLL